MVEIDIAGYVFLDLASSFKPLGQLTKFLDTRSEKLLVYIGFGLIADIENPAAFTKMIFDAVEKAGVRALISKGWGGMGDGMDIPDSVCMLDNTPHDWLFPRVVLRALLGSLVGVRD
jgi:UDP:flavonoid glycosyltransferase YjiC (YdhE family)